MEHREHAPGIILHGAGFYDALLWLLTLGREGRLREKMLELARLSPGESVLDVGCGTGTLAILAKKRGAANVSGVDASPEMIARAQKKARNLEGVSFVVAPAQALPFAEQTFDLALATIMLHHLGRPARAQCAAELKRALKPSGRVLVVDFEESAKKNGILGRLRHRHAHVASMDVEQLLREAGFTVTDRGPVGFRDLHFTLGSAATSAGGLHERRF